MRHRPREQGIALAAIATLLALALVAALTTAIARSATGPRRAAVSDQALSTAREALIAHAASRPLDEIVGPGYLPCPDLDDDGWAEPTCGSMTGETGQWQRLGRLPWKTLVLPDLRDAFVERLWYAVSSKHKGLLNCTASPACLDMGPEAALGTITVRSPSGAVIHDGTSANVVYSLALLSTSISATIVQLTLQGNDSARTNLTVTLPNAQAHRLRFAPGAGLVILARGTGANLLDVANYLYKLVTEILPCSLNPYNLVNNINGSIMRKMDVIQKERPDIIAMMQKMATVPVEAHMKPFIRTGFPNC